VRRAPEQLAEHGCPGVEPTKRLVPVTLVMAAGATSSPGASPNGKISPTWISAEANEIVPTSSSSLGPRGGSRSMTSNFSRRLSLLAIPVAALAYMRIVRPWQLTWGATADEVEQGMPGDELVEHPTLCATRAITIAAPPERVFPWLVQVGVHRAGWYSYDWLDNLGRPSARTIHPEFQQVEPGQLLPMSPNGKHGIRIYSLDPPTEMIWGTPSDTTWSWRLEVQPDGKTRLITRIRSQYRWSSPTILFSALLEFADIWMMRKMLLNLRERIEALEPRAAGVR
jgi:hypothetical protein